MFDYKVMTNDQIIISNQGWISLISLYMYADIQYYAYDLQTPKWHKSQLRHKSQNVNINFVLKFWNWCIKKWRHFFHQSSVMIYVSYIYL